MKRYLVQLQISKQAFLEIEESKEYYNLQKMHLGDDFKWDVQKCFDRIVATPNLYPNIDKNIKRVLLHRFPFSIFYSITSGVILILSVAHQHRKPKY